jgi:hypothetical protein
MKDTNDNESTAARNYVAVRLVNEDYKALRLLAAMDRRPMGGILEVLLAKSIEERQDEIDEFVAKEAARAKKKAAREQAEARSAA